MKIDEPDSALAVSPPDSQARPKERGSFAQTVDVLRVRDFRVLETGMVLSMAAMQMNIISRTWLAYHISGSALALGTVAMARGLPQLFMSPIAGVAADRFDKRKLLMTTQGCMALLALINAVLVHLGVIQVWHLVLLGLAQGFVFPFTMPSRQAMIPHFAGNSRLAQAFAIDSAGRNLNRVLAPSIGGVLIAWHPVIAFYAIAGAYAGAALTVACLPAVKAARSVETSAARDLADGIRYVFSNRTLLALIVIAFIAVVLGQPIQQFLTVFQREILHVTPRELGFMYTAIGIGALLGSGVIAGIANSPYRGAIQMGFGVTFGASLVCFALSHYLITSLASLTVVGLASEGYMTINRVEVITNTDSTLLGRVLGIYVMTWALMPISALPLGFFVDIFGPSATFAGAGSLMVLALVVVITVHPAVWHARRLHSLGVR
jgi:predicted MFS family arabinose efflux permease